MTTEPAGTGVLSTTVHTVPAGIPLIVEPDARPPPAPKLITTFWWAGSPSLQFTNAVNVVGSGVAGGPGGGMTTLSTVSEPNTGGVLR